MNENKEHECMICHKKFVFIAPMHLATHNMTMAQYKEQFPGCSVGSTRGKKKIILDKDSFSQTPITIKIRADILRQTESYCRVTKKNRDNVIWDIVNSGLQALLEQKKREACEVLKCLK